MPPSLPTLRLDDQSIGEKMKAISEQRRMFVRALVFDGLSQQEAARAARYSDSSDGVLASIGSRLAQDPKVKEAIVECTLQLVVAEGAASVRELVRLRDKSKDERIRLKAASSLADRAGLTAITQMQVNHNHTHELSEAALDARILTLLRDAGVAESEARKMLINAEAIDAEYSEVPADDDALEAQIAAEPKRARPVAPAAPVQKSPEQIERSERYERNGENERRNALAAMSPEEREIAKAELHAKSRAAAREKYAEAQKRALAEELGIADLI